MQISVFGANGKVGSLVVQKALDRDIDVVAFVHGATKLIASDNLKIITGDIYNKSEVYSAIKGSDAVVSALGSWGTHNKNILTTGMHNIIPSMQKLGVKRIISLTGSDTTIGDENNNAISKLSRLILNIFAKKILQDGQNHIQLLADSGLEWTVVRSPIMNLRGVSSGYELTKIKPLPWVTINRNCVARSMIDLIRDKNFIKQAPHIKRKKI